MKNRNKGKNVNNNKQYLKVGMYKLSATSDKLLR